MGGRKGTRERRESVLRQGMVPNQFLNAVEAAEDMLIQMEQESDY